MPLQNRVTPFGTLIATTSRGAWMGNRGILHDANGNLTGRRWTTLGWVICRLSFKERHRNVMSPGRYTELFFLDEATALAAGHRPCFECRRADAMRFRAAWQKAFGVENIGADDMNRAVHPERKRPIASRPVVDDAARLPDGAIIAPLDEPDSAWLIRNNVMMRWSSDGYSDPRPASRCHASLLTPPSTIAVLSAGFAPQIHASACQVI